MISAMILYRIRSCVSRFQKGSRYSATLKRILINQYAPSIHDRFALASAWFLLQLGAEGYRDMVKKKTNIASPSN